MIATPDGVYTASVTEDTSTQCGLSLTVNRCEENDNGALSPRVKKKK